MTKKHTNPDGEPQPDTNERAKTPDQQLVELLTAKRDQIITTLKEPSIWEPGESGHDRRLVAQINTVLTGLQTLAERPDPELASEGPAA